MTRTWPIAASLLLAAGPAQAQVSAMSGIEPEIVRGGARHAAPDAATNPAPGTTTPELVRETNAAAGPVDPIAPGTPNAAAPRAHLQPHN